MYEEMKISAPTRKEYERDKGNINPDALVFLEDEEKLITPEKEYQFVPSGVDLNKLKNINGLYVSVETLYTRMDEVNNILEQIQNRLASLNA